MIEVVCEKNDRASMWLSQEQLVIIRKALYEAECAALVRGDVMNQTVYDITYEEVKWAMIEAWPEEDWN